MSVSANRVELDFPEEIQALEFCPFVQGKDLLIVCGEKKFYLQQLKLSEETGLGHGELKDVLQVKDLLVVFHGRDINHLTWSPNTNIAHTPKCIEFAVATCDYKLVLYQLDMADNPKFTEVGHHTGIINETAFSPNEAHLLASVSDDYTCKIWDVNKAQEVSQIQLKSPGISVNFHSDSPTQLMVAEEHGKIGFYDIRSHTAVTSLEVPGPLGSAHWAPSELNLVAATAGHEVFFWNIAKSSIPVDQRMLLMQQAQIIRWERSSSNLYGVVGRMKGGVFSIYHRAHQKAAQPNLIPANFNPVISTAGNETHSPEGTPTATSVLTPTGLPASLPRCPLHTTDTSIYRYPSFVAVPATHPQQVQLTPGGNTLQNYMKQSSSPNGQNMNIPNNVFNTQEFPTPFNTLQKTLQPTRNPFSPHMAYPGVNPIMLHENQFVSQQRFPHQQFPGLLAHTHQSFTGTPRYKLTPERASPLLEWFEKHKHHPYPSRMEKIGLCDITQLNYTQVSNWFANARRRMKQRQKVSDSGTPGPDSKQNRDSTFTPY